MTTDEIKEFARKYFANAKERCFEEELGQCRYRGPNNTTCIVGAMIGDELALFLDNLHLGVTPLLDKVLSGDLQDMPKIPAFILDNAELLGFLQAHHDCGANWDEDGFTGDLKWLDSY